MLCPLTYHPVHWLQVVKNLEKVTRVASLCCRLCWHGILTDGSHWGSTHANVSTTICLPLSEYGQHRYRK